MSEHLFRYDLERSDVTVATETAGNPGLSHAHRDAPTLACVTCGLRLAHVAAPNGRVSAACGMDMESLVRTGKRLPVCRPLGSAEGLADLARREAGRG